jgi:hypothetical protein
MQMTDGLGLPKLIWIRPLVKILLALKILIGAYPDFTMIMRGKAIPWDITLPV